MKRATRFSWFICAAVVIGLAGGMAHGDAEAPASPQKVNIGSLVTEIMNMRVDGQQQHLVMWMPFEFFVACGTAQGDSWETAARNMKVLRPYHIVCISREITHDDNSSTYATEDQLKASVVIRGPSGKEVKPLETVPAEVSAIATVMRKSMAAQGGAAAENMRLLFFPRTVDGKEFGAADQKGKFVLDLKPIDSFEAGTVTYHTPFDALKPQHICPNCKESVSAKWTYCPWCGAKQ